MTKYRIAVIGDTRLEFGELTDAGAIAIELAAGWRADVGIRTIAHSAQAWESLDEAFGKVGVTSWMSVREDAPSLHQDTGASIRMGDMLNIDELFAHDLVILATPDQKLRRFLADLPVHTWPGVRIMGLIHLHDGIVATDDVLDLTRFDSVIGSDDAFAAISRHGESSESGIAAFAEHIRGSNLRAAVSWGRHGAFRCVTPEDAVVTIPPHHAPTTTSDAPWAAFVAAVAIGMISRQSWEEIGREATRRFAVRSQERRNADN
jgi:hypothetical protein